VRYTAQCLRPAETYVEPGKWESYIQFGKTKERIFTDPGKTLELLNYIASGSEYDSTSQIDTNKYYPYNSQPLNTFGMMGMINNGMAQQQSADANAQSANANTVQPAAKTDTWKCLMCGDVNTGKFCMNCGSPGPDN